MCEGDRRIRIARMPFRCVDEYVEYLLEELDRQDVDVPQEWAASLVHGHLYANRGSLLEGG